ncbi:MAG: metal-dependent phosphohydrolase, partial [Pirellulales bacterium]|nr:metal-dependent phosphohydrolase [Pirellulales bacterium]
MSGASKQRSQKERIESLGIQKPRLVEWWQRSDKADGAIRMAMAVVAAVAMLAACQTWQPTFPYRTNEIPDRDLITRVTFEVVNENETEIARNKKASEQIAFYKNRTQPLDQL